MTKLSIEFIEEYNEIIKKLILCHYPDVCIDGAKYHIPSKHLTVQITSRAFWCSLDTSVYHHVQIFRNKGFWKFFFLQFGIHLTASTGKTYSYPSLRDMEVQNHDDLLILASYMFSCANTAILFFDYERKKSMDEKFKSPMEGLFTYEFIAGGISVKDPAHS